MVGTKPLHCMCCNACVCVCVCVCLYLRVWQRVLQRSCLSAVIKMQTAFQLGSSHKPSASKDALQSRAPVPQRCRGQAPCRRAAAKICKERLMQGCARAQSSDLATPDVRIEPEAETQGMSAWLDGLKWDAGGLVAVIVQVSQRRWCDRT